MLRKVKFSKKVWCAIIVLELLLLAICAFVYRKRETVTLQYAEDNLVYDSGESGFYLDTSFSNAYVGTPDFVLPKGLYTVEIQYDYVGCVAFLIQHSDNLYGNIISGNIPVSRDRVVTCDFRVRYSDRPMQVRARLTGDAVEGDYILLRHITISPSPVAMRNFLFQLVMWLLVLDGLLLLYTLKDKICIGDEALSHAKVLLLLIGFSCLPLMVDYLFSTHDLPFHLLRIEGIKAGLQSGMFPVRIQPNWLGGHGYAASVFYGDIFLYIPAILRIFGVSMQAAYKFYIVLVNTATVLLSYFCFSKMSSARTGLVCTVLYSLNIYRLTSLYTMGRVGEYTSMIFMPLVLYGFWRVYTLPEDTEEHKRSYIPITIGCTGIFLSHVLSTELVAAFVILACVVLWKRTFRKKTFLVLLKAAGLTVLLNLCFLVPFVDYMVNGIYLINTPNSYEPYHIEARGAYLAQFFMMDYDVTGPSRGYISGAANEMPITLGIASLVVLAGWCLLCLWKKERDKEERRREYFALFLIAVSLWMATLLFPYTWFATRIPILQMPVRSLQYQWRTLGIAAVVITYLLCLVLQKEWIEKRKRQIFVAVIVSLSFWQGLSYMSKCLNEAGPERLYQAGNLSSFDILGGEYLPGDGKQPISLTEYPKAYVNQLTYDEASVSVENWERTKKGVEVSLVNHTKQTVQVEVPLLLYKGYQAVADTGESLQIEPGKSYRISVSVPANFTGSFRVEFHEPWYWRLCEMISLLTFLGMVVYLSRNRWRHSK